MGKKVLVVDDEASLRRMVAFALMQRGYDTELCENGTKGLQALETYKKNNLPLDFAIIDIRLPDIDGIELLKAIKANYPAIPVVLITGHGNQRIAEAAKNADGFLEKPFDMDQLAKILDEMPETKRQESAQSPSLSEGPSCNVYVLVTLDPGADRTDVYQRLYKLDNLVFCDVVRGKDLMLLMRADGAEKLAKQINEQVRTVPGVADITSLNVETPLTTDDIPAIMTAVDKAFGSEKTLLRNRFVVSLIDFLDVLNAR